MTGNKQFVEITDTKDVCVFTPFLVNGETFPPLKFAVKQDYLLLAPYCSLLRSAIDFYTGVWNDSRYRMGNVSSFLDLGGRGGEGSDSDKAGRAAHTVMKGQRGRGHNSLSPFAS